MITLHDESLMERYNQLDKSLLEQHNLVKDILKRLQSREGVRRVSIFYQEAEQNTV